MWKNFCWRECQKDKVYCSSLFYRDYRSGVVGSHFNCSRSGKQDRLKLLLFFVHVAAVAVVEEIFVCSFSW